MTSDELRKLADELVEWGNIPPVIGARIHEFAVQFSALQAENERLRSYDAFALAARVKELEAENKNIRWHWAQGLPPFAD